MLDRRAFLSCAAELSGILAVDKSLLGRLSGSVQALPDRDLYSENQEVYWEELRKQFLIPETEIYLNNGTAGSSPLPVLRAIFEAYNESEKMEERPEEYPVWGYGPWNGFRDPLATFVGASRDELALLRNATEANNFIANGLDMHTGDEVLISDQDPLGEFAWNLRAKRYGIVVRKFQLPKPANDSAEILNRINDAITSRTRVLFFSHITLVTGLVMPAKEICSLARSKGILSAVDGAHVVGMMNLDLHDLGCDMYGASPHKWLMATKGTGFLYVRNELIDRVWTTIATEGWDDPKLRAERFQRIGSSNVPSLYGLLAAIKFANNIGMERIEKRHRDLSDYITTEMVKRGADSWTSKNPALRCGIATVNLPPFIMRDLQSWMWDRHRIKIIASNSLPSKLRLSTPYYLRRRDIDRFLEKFDEYKRLGQR